MPRTRVTTPGGWGPVRPPGPCPRLIASLPPGPVLRIALALTLLLVLVRVGLTSSGDEVGAEQVAPSVSDDAPRSTGSATPATGQGTGTLAVYIDGVQPGAGDVVVWLFRSVAGFPYDHRAAYREVRLSATARALTVLIEDVPDGPVAVVAFHDEDDSGRVRLDDEGRAVEGAGTSGAGGAPTDFDRAALVVRPDEVTVVRVALQYS